VVVVGADCCGGEVRQCKKGFSKRVEEARMCGSEKRRFSGMAVAAITTIHRGRPTGLHAAQAQSILAAFTAMPAMPAMPWPGAGPCKCACVDSDRAVRLFYRSSPLLARLAAMAVMMRQTLTQALLVVVAVVVVL
jgi:hypothetical protein